MEETPSHSNSEPLPESEETGRMRLRPVPGGGFAVSSTLPRLRTRRRTSHGFLMTSAAPAPPSAQAGPLPEDIYQACMANVAALELALKNWEQVPGTDGPEGRAFLDELKKLRRILPTKALAFEFFTAFHLLQERTQACLESSQGSRIFLPLVLRKCVRDMRHYFERKARRADFPWLPKWKFYFDSLQIATASASTQDAPTAGTSPVSPAEEAALDPEMLEVFAEEANGLLETAERALLRWEQSDDPEEQQRSLRRAWHTLKGAANSLNLRRLGQGFHTLEDFVQNIDPQQPPAFTFPLLFSTLDQTREYVGKLAFQPAPIWPHDWETEIARLRAGTGGTSQAAASLPTPAVQEKPLIRVEAEKLQGLLHELSEITLVQLRLETGLKELEALQIRLGKNGNATEAKALAGILRQVRGEQDHTRRRLRALQNDLAALNMTPANALFRRLQRVFRDAVQQEGKDADLLIEGGGTLLDRSVLDALFDPLLHLVRNAVAHGLEPVETRIALNKPSRGQITLRAVPFSNQAVFEVRDDGAGIRIDKVLARARERGLVDASTTELTLARAVELLFHPGFSTAESITEVAGRGVGLDAVKNQIETMNGTLAVDATEGQGSTWSVTVPLSLSALELLEVGVGSQTFGLPLSQVDQCLLLEASKLKSADEGLVYPWRGQDLPCHSLAVLLGLPAVEFKHRHGVIIDSGSFRVVLGVDALVARREAILKNLGFLEAHLPWYSGAALDGRGSLVPVLHPAALLRRKTLPVPSPTPAPSLPVAPKPLSPATAPWVLVVDDSPSVRALLRQKMTALGFSVAEASDGQEALARLSEQSFALILTDQEMPGMNGLELLRALPGHPTAQGTPAVMITSLQEEALQIEARQAGAFAFLPKPPRDEDLQSVLRELHLSP